MNDDNTIEKKSDDLNDLNDVENIDSCKEELDKLNLKLNETFNLFLRAKADLENLKKRTDREIEYSVKYANKKFLYELLPLIDSLEACLNIKDKNDTVNDMFIFYKMLMSILDKFNLRQIVATIGGDFDPLLHEAVSSTESGEHDNLICEVFQTGYVLHDQVLRYSKVSIFKKK